MFSKNVIEEFPMRSYILLALFFITISSTIIAQSTTGVLEGRIVFENDASKNGVELFLQKSNSVNIKKSSPNSSGNFIFSKLSTGKYSLKIVKPFCKRIIIENITIALGQTTSLNDIVLVKAEHELDEIVITDEKTSIDLSSTTAGNSLSTETFESLPLERNYKSIATITPQVNVSYLGDDINISGSTGLENVFYIDGANVTDPADAASSIQLPYNFIQTIEVKTGGYEAEYGRSLGGMINVVTSTGTNDIKVNAFGFFTNSALGGEAKAGLSSATIPSYAEYDYGVSVSGPIIKDKLFFFAAYNPNNEISDIELTTFGIYQATSSSHLFAGKLTWLPSINTNINLSIIGNPRTRHQVLVDDIGDFTLLNPDVVLQKRDDGGINFSLTGTHILSKYFLIEGTITHLSQVETTEPDSERGWDGLYMDFVEGTISGGRQAIQDDKYGRMSARISTSAFFANHQIKIGMEYEDNNYSLNVKNLFDLSWVARVDLSTWYSQIYDLSGDVSNRIVTAYLQDSWKIGHNFRLNAGLRVDNQYFIGENGNVVQKITNQFQPRLGFIFHHGDNYRTKYFASFGRFYEQIPTRFIAMNYTNSSITLTAFDHNPLDDPTGGITHDLSPPTQTEIENLEGQYFDEYIVGLEQTLPQNFKIGIRGVYRNVGQVIDDFVNPDTGEKMVGNPGSDRISFIPSLIRKYQALEFFANKISGDNYQVLASYVLSKNSGNYTGLYNQDVGNFMPNMNPMPDYPFQIDNSTGLLPNNITHMLKISGAYKFNFGLTCGANFSWQSGSPLSEYGVDPYGLQASLFLSERGTAGETPALTNLDLRLKYDLGSLFNYRRKINILVDVFNVFDQKKGVRFDQEHYYSTDENGNPAVENPNYLNAVKYTPPRTIRIGIEAELF